MCGATVESTHNYAANTDSTWIITKANVSNVSVTFSSDTKVESGYDYIYIYNKNGTQIGKYTGTELASKKITVAGDTLKIRLTSDHSAQYYGFKITKFEYMCTNHSYSSWTTTKAATCTADGSKKRTCSVCSASETATISKIAHNYINSGCSMCGATVQSAHDYAANTDSTWIITKANASNVSVTFSSDTKVESGYDYIYIYNKNGTQIGKYTGTELANKKITVAGDTLKIRLTSDHSYQYYGFKITKFEYNVCTNHSYSSWTTTKAATCTADGSKKRTCTKCSATETATIAKLGHNYVATVVAPGCTAQGYTLHKCSRCSNSYKDTYTSAKGHSYGSWTTTRAATCTADGSKKRTCSVCSASETATIAKLGHNYVATVVAPTYKHEGYTLHKCSRCDNSYKDSYTSKLTVSVVTGLKASTTSNSVKLTWNRIDGATGYLVYRSINGKWARVGTVHTNTFTESNLKAGTSYRYAVKAYKTLNGTNYYSPSYPTLWTSTLPGKVAGLKAATTTETAIKLAWNKKEGATGYYVYQQKSGKWVKIATTTALTYTVSNLSRSTRYKFAVRAYKTLDRTVYNASSYPTLTASTLGRYTFTWGKVSGATGYQLQVSAYSNFSGAKTYTTTMNSKTVTGLIKGKVYYSRLRAYKTKNGKTTYSSWTYTKKITV